MPTWTTGAEGRREHRPVLEPHVGRFLERLASFSRPIPSTSAARADSIGQWSKEIGGRAILAVPLIREHVL
jgi:hypothetical protein